MTWKWLNDMVTFHVWQVTPNGPVWGTHMAPTVGSWAARPGTHGLLGSVTRIWEVSAPPRSPVVSSRPREHASKTTPSAGLHCTPGGAQGCPHGLAFTAVKKSFVIISYLREGKYLFSELEVSCMTSDL